LTTNSERVLKIAETSGGKWGYIVVVESFLSKRLSVTLFSPTNAAISPLSFPAITDSYLTFINR